MENKCWICNKEEATTGEHMVMKAAYERVLGKLTNGEQAMFSYVGGKKNIPMRSFKNDRLKFKKSICQGCNGSLTQPYDNEFIAFVEKIINCKKTIISRNKISLNVFNKSYLALYFLKIFGCFMNELRANVLESDYQLIRKSIIQGRVLTTNVYLSAHRDLKKTVVKGGKTLAHFPLNEKDYCSWVIDFDWVSLMLCYPFCPIQKKYGTQWNFSKEANHLYLGKLT